MKSSDPFWTENMSILFNKSRVLEFWPSHQLSFVEQANAMSRFLLYAGIILSIVRKQSIPLLFAILLIICCAIIVKRAEPDKIHGHISGKFPQYQGMMQDDCTAPTNENPFANVLMHEYTDNPQRKPACYVDDVSNDINDKFFNDFIQDPFDVFNRKHSQRQFFSTANTQIPNNREAFAYWLYGKDGPTCKEDPEVCKGNEAFGSGGNSGGSGC